MSRALCLAFLVTTMMLSLLDAQSTVDDGASCQSSTLYETVKLIRKGFTDMKNLGSTLGESVNQIRNNMTDVKAIKEDLLEVKNLLGSLKQPFGAIDSSSLCEYKTRSLSYAWTWKLCALYRVVKKVSQ